MQAIMQAIQALLNAPDIEGVKTVIQQHQDMLLTDDAEAILTENIENALPGTPPQAISSLNNIRDLLRLCRQQGIDTTFEQLQQGAAMMSPIVEAMQALLTAPDIDALEATIRERASLLLTDDADVIFTQNIEHAPAGVPPEFVDALTDRREILRLCRQLGIDAAFRRLKSSAFPEGEIPPIMQALQELLRAATLDDVKATVQRHADLLLTGDADQILTQNIDNVPPGTPEELITGLHNARDLLRLSREHGMEQAFMIMRSGGEVYGADDTPTDTDAASDGARIPGEFEDRVVAGLSGSPKDKMDLFNYLETLPGIDSGLRALIDTIKRAVFSDVGKEGDNLSGEYAALWARIARRVQAGG